MNSLVEYGNYSNKRYVSLKVFFFKNVLSLTNLI